MKPLCLSMATAMLLTASVTIVPAYPLYRYGYGQPFVPYARGYRYRFGPYGLGRGLPNGTGYRGRGSFTGGPAGGLPNRN